MALANSCPYKNKKLKISCFECHWDKVGTPYGHYHIISTNQISIVILKLFTYFERANFTSDFLPRNQFSDPEDESTQKQSAPIKEERTWTSPPDNSDSDI
jgi:hypothetical protein